MYLHFPLLTDNTAVDINHPVHIVHGDDVSMSPSAFIPFCEFGGDMSAMGVKIEQFDNPVCNSFKAKVLNDQLCYEVDLEKFKNPGKLHLQLKLGLVFFMDYNEDKQLVFENSNRTKAIMSRGQAIDGSNEDENAFIYLNTIGKYQVLFSEFLLFIFLIRTCQVGWWRKIQLEFCQRYQGNRIIPGTGPECEGM